MTVDTLEKRALADKRNEHTATHRTSKGALTVCWDEAFEYYDETRPGAFRPLDRDEAIDFLNDIEWKAA